MTCATLTTSLRCHDALHIAKLILLANPIPKGSIILLFFMLFMIIIIIINIIAILFFFGNDNIVVCCSFDIFVTFSTTTKLVFST